MSANEMQKRVSASQVLQNCNIAEPSSLCTIMATYNLRSRHNLRKQNDDPGTARDDRNPSQNQRMQVRFCQRFKRSQDHEE